MKMYIDLLVILNFFIDLIILIGESKLLKLNVKIKRIILGSIIGSLSTLLLLYNFNIVVINIIKLLISIIIIITTFGYKNIIKNIFYFYIISIILGGSIYLISTNILKEINLLTYLIVLIILVPIIVIVYIKDQLSYKNKIDNIYKVVLFINKKKYELRGFIDTGNNLKDPYFKRRVILLNNDIKIAKSKYIIIPYKALNYEGIIRCLKPDKVIIKDKEFKNCLIGLSKNNLGLDIDCLLPNKFKEDL